MKSIFTDPIVWCMIGIIGVIVVVGVWAIRDANARSAIEHSLDQRCYPQIRVGEYNDYYGTVKAICLLSDGSLEAR